MDEKISDDINVAKANELWRWEEETGRTEREKKESRRGRWAWVYAIEDEYNKYWDEL